MLSWLLAATLAVTPQATPAGPPPAQATAPGQVPTPEQVHAVPADLQRRLDAALPPPSAPARERLDRLLAFMSDDAGMGLRYQSDATLTVAEAYTTRQANCLTWTLVLLALAPRAGLQAHAQEISHTLSWYQQAGTVFLDSHVNATVRVGRTTLEVDVSGNDLISRDPPFEISQQRLLSHYYNNRAVALLAEGAFRDAAAFSAKALELAPDSPDHWSNAGVIRVRNGDLEGAVAAYTKALALDPRNASALFNAVVLAHRLGDAANEARLRARLARVQRSDPFHQFLRALEMEHRGDLAQAITHYRMAVRLRPGEHRFHAALARACQREGDLRCAAMALHRARAASEGKARAGYQAQLDALRAARLRHADARRGGWQDQ